MVVIHVRDMVSLEELQQPWAQRLDKKLMKYNSNYH